MKMQIDSLQRLEIPILFVFSPIFIHSRDE